MSVKRISLPGLSGGYDFLNTSRRCTAGLLLLCALSLSSCGPVLSFLDRDKDASQNGSVNPYVSPENSANPEDSGDGSIAPMAPPGSSDRPPAPGTTGAEYMPNGLPALQPRGVAVSQLFAEKMKDPDQRFKRLENAVIEMRQEFDAVMPSIVRLVAVEQDMQDLMSQLETLLQTEPAPDEPDALDHAAGYGVPTAPVAAQPQSGTGRPAALTPEAPSEASTPPAEGKTEPADAPSQPVPQAQPVTPLAVQPPPTAQPPPGLSLPEGTVFVPAPGQTAATAKATAPVVVTPPAAQPATGGPLRVTGLRFGEHGDQTRIVLDLSGPAQYRQDLDNGENLLVIELPAASWSGAQKGTSKLPLVASWTAQPTEDGKGSRVIVVLKKAATVVNASTLSGPDRIVLDLAAR